MAIRVLVSRGYHPTYAATRDTRTCVAFVGGFAESLSITTGFRNGCPRLW